MNRRKLRGNLRMAGMNRHRLAYRPIVFPAQAGMNRRVSMDGTACGTGGDRTGQKRVRLLNKQVFPAQAGMNRGW